MPLTVIYVAISLSQSLQSESKFRKASDEGASCTIRPRKSHKLYLILRYRVVPKNIKVPTNLSLNHRPKTYRDNVIITWKYAGVWLVPSHLKFHYFIIKQLDAHAPGAGGSVPESTATVQHRRRTEITAPGPRRDVRDVLRTRYRGSWSFIV